MKSKFVRIIVDLVMFITLVLVVATPYFIRIPAIGRGWDFLGWNLSTWHQNLGWFLLILMIVHILLNIRWQVLTLKNWKKLNKATKIQEIVIILLFIFMAASIASGAVWGRFSGPAPPAGVRTGEHLRYPGSYSRHPGEYRYVGSDVAIYIDGEYITDLGGVSIYIDGEYLPTAGAYVYVQGDFIYTDGRRVYIQGAFRYDDEGNPVRASATQHVRVIHILTSWGAVLFAGMHIGVHFNRFLLLFKSKAPVKAA